MRTLPAQMVAEIVNYRTTTERYRVDAKRDVLQACKMMYLLCCLTWSKDQGCSEPLCCGMDIRHLVVIWYCTVPLQIPEGNKKWTDVSYKSAFWCECALKRCILIAFPCQRKAPLEETAVHVVSIRKLDVPVITSVDINDI